MIPKAMLTHARKFTTIAFALAAGIAVGFFIGGRSAPRAGSTGEAACQPDSPYLNPGLFCLRESYTVDKREYLEFKKKLTGFIQAEQERGAIRGASVYFRDLINGPVMEIEPNAGFSPASLLKVPILIAYLKLAEEDPRLLEKRLQVSANGVTETDEPAGTGKGASYTVQELLRIMIVHSDNVAKQALSRYFQQRPDGEGLLVDTYLSLGLGLPDADGEDFLTVKQYGALFRILFNASYLSEEMSERALEMLSRTTYTQGIVAGVPKEVSVAHKFGHRMTPDFQEQLHDCGIVYYPGNPYLLCVMTRGDDQKKLPAVIEEISRMVYEEFDARAEKGDLRI